MSSENRRDPEGGGFDDEISIDVLAYLRVLYQYKRMILVSVFTAAVVAAGVSLLMQNIYRADVLLAPAQSKDAKGGGFVAALGSLGGLASMAGISVGGGSTEEYLAVLKSREFLWKFVQEKNLLPILFANQWDEQQKRWKSDDPKEQPGIYDVERLLGKGGVLTVITDKKTELTTLSVEWNDAKFAATLANDLVSSLNLYLAKEASDRSERNLKYLYQELGRTQVDEIRKSLFDLISQEQKNAMLAHAQREFAFRVLDQAVTPDRKVKPRRSFIVLATAMVAGLLASVVALYRGGGLFARKEREYDMPVAT